jgi:small subunit ribosomal protein S9
VAREYYATGHRKNATAKVWLTPGEGRFTVNNQPMREYVKRTTLELKVLEPLQLATSVGSFDVRAQCLGGGLSGQAGALRHGIAKALVVMDEGLRTVMRSHHLMTRDSRVKERKKYGRKRARRGFQFKKR